MEEIKNTWCSQVPHAQRIESFFCILAIFMLKSHVEYLLQCRARAHSINNGCTQEIKKALKASAN
jgi:hypothetical protein